MRNPRVAPPKVEWLLLLGVAGAVPLRGQQAPAQRDPDPTRFRAQIDAYLEADATAPPAAGEIVFIGSSIFRLWRDLNGQMAPLPVHNRAFGGSQTADVLHYMDRIVLPYRPRVVVYYCGSNDVNAGRSAGAIIARIRAFHARLRRELPEARMFFVSVIRAPQKRNRWPVVDSVNAQLRRDAAAESSLDFIDVNPALLDADGGVRGELYLSDSLHYRPEAYERFAEVVRPVLERYWAGPPRPRDTEVWEPVPAVVEPGPYAGSSAPPSDAIVLFDGSGLNEWVNVNDGMPAGWRLEDGVLTVVKSAGSIQTRRQFGSYQLHLEWRIPEGITGEGQARGNSGLYLAYRGAGQGGYEVQILDSHGNRTYVNGMAGSVYKQSIPLVNASRPPGEWQTYDVVWTAPSFAADGSVQSPARVTVIHNGILVQNDFVLRGETVNTGLPEYHPFDGAPIMLQAHGDPSPPISFRNIWLRPLP